MQDTAPAADVTQGPLEIWRATPGIQHTPGAPQQTSRYTADDRYITVLLELRMPAGHPQNCGHWLSINCPRHLQQLLSVITTTQRRLQRTQCDARN
jgi:hypothetical protein